MLGRLASVLLLKVRVVVQTGIALGNAELPKLHIYPTLAILVSLHSSATRTYPIFLVLDAHLDQPVVVIGSETPLLRLLILLHQSNHIVPFLKAETQHANAQVDERTSGFEKQMWLAKRLIVRVRLSVAKKWELTGWKLANQVSYLK